MEAVVLAESHLVCSISHRLCRSSPNQSTSRPVPNWLASTALGQQTHTLSGNRGRVLRSKLRQRRKHGICMDLELNAVVPAAVAGALALTFTAYRAVLYFQLEYLNASMLSNNVPKGGARVVDIKIKQGRNLYYLPKDTVQVIAFDPQANKGLLDQVGVQAGVPVDVRLQSPTNMNLPTSSVDAVISTYALAEQTDLKRVLQEAVRVLKPGKPFVFIERVSASEGLAGVLQKALSVFGEGKPVTEETIKLLQATPGFEDVQMEMVYENQDPHVLGVALKKADAAVPSESPRGLANTTKKKRR